MKRDVFKWPAGILAFLLAVPCARGADGPIYDPFLQPFVTPATPTTSPSSSATADFQTSLFTGAATYAYPIAVPPGTHGLAPDVQLTYNSQRRGEPSWTGLGWSLNDSYIQRDAHFTPADTNDDTFQLILSGERHDLALTVPPPQVMLQFHMDETSGDIVHDSSGSGRDGTAVDTIIVPGYAGNARSIGNGGSINAPTLPTIPDAIYEAWVRPMTWTGAAQMIINQYQQGSGRQLALDGSGRPYLWISTTGALFAPQPIPLNAWTHLKAVFDETHHQMRLYVNDVPVIEGFLGTGTGSGGTLNVGYFAPAANAYFQGAIDEVSITQFFAASRPPETAGRFWTQPDTHLWVERKSGSTANDKSDYWIVRAKDGTEYRFGYTRDAEAVSTTQPYVSRWHLDQVTDVHGNQIFYTYVENPSANDVGATYLSRIEYNREKARRVEFVLEPTDRTDRRPSYVQGSRIITARRLQEIRVLANNALVRSCKLGYTLNDARSQSLLTDITEYGSDGTSSLPPTTFTYQPAVRGWQETPSWAPPGPFSSFWKYTNDEFSGPVIRDDGLQWVDVNGDGRIDLLKGFVDGKGGGETRTAWLNTGNAWTETPSRQPPVSWTTFYNEDTLGTACDGTTITNYGGSRFHQHSVDDGVRVAELNGDGLPDLLLGHDDREHGSSPRTAWLNTGNGWVAAPSWSPPQAFSAFCREGTKLGFLVRNTDTGLRLADLNGDGLTDLIKGGQGERAAWLNTGTGWAPANQWAPPMDFASPDGWQSVDTGLRLADLNGDGLVDLIANGSAWLNTGNGWIAANQWAPPVPFVTDRDTNWRLADVNGDGLTDLIAPGAAYLNTGNGWAAANDWGSPVAFSEFSNTQWLAQQNRDQGVRFADVNGDGAVDLVKGYGGDLRAWLNKQTFPDLLTAIHASLGAQTTIAYAPSTTFDNTGADGRSHLPFPVAVVTQVTTTNGLTGPQAFSSTYQYAYRGGLYDRPSHEFRGFAAVTVTAPDGTRTTQTFHQDDARKGKMFDVQVTDAAGAPYQHTQHTWTVTTADGISDVQLTATTESTHDGVTANPKMTTTQYAYDGYGNVTKTSQLGDAALTGDERYDYSEYVYNPARWIADRVKHRYRRAADDATTMQEQWRYYDGQSLDDTPLAGDLTRQEDWLDTSAARVATTFEYDAFGNVTKTTDALNHTMSQVYDAPTGTFVVSRTNALNQQATYTYDPGTGHLLTQTDPNGATTTRRYDTFGRLTKLIGPLDSDDFPTLTYAYDRSTVPSRTTIEARAQSGQPSTLTSYVFVDGDGRTVQARSPAEDGNQQVVAQVTSVTPRGQPFEEWLPYLGALSTAYQPPDPAAPKTTSSYDALNRVTRVTHADGSYQTIQYDHWQQTRVDANGHQVRRSDDAFGRLTMVEEFTGADGRSAVYPATPFSLYATTRYDYDALDRLTRVTDTQGHSSTATYDSLGRKTAMADPDLGAWTYAYDAVGNLLTQTDARNLTTTFAYDALNRVTQKTFSGPIAGSPVTYVYDEPGHGAGTGRLTRIQDGAGESSYTYDPLGRMTQESRTIDGTQYVVQRAYDLLGRVTALTYPDGAVANYTYNAQGGVETIASVVSDMDYNTAGQLTRIVGANGVATDYAYDPQTLRLAHLHTTSPGGTLQDFSYSYDGAGNILQVADATHTATRSYHYDERNRVIDASGNYGTESYAYDALGNLTVKGAQTLGYGLADGSKPHAVTSAGNANFTYDANGNMAQQQAGSTPRASYLFDADNRLTQMTTYGSADRTTQITLQPGWNFFSLPLAPENRGIAAVFPTFAQDIEQIARYNPADGSFERFVSTDPAEAAYNQFTELEPARGYEVYCTNPSGITVTITGQPATTTSYALTAGWRLIGSTVDTNLLIRDLLAGLVQGADYSLVQHYDPQTKSVVTVNPATTTVKPGEALYVQCLRAVAWTPPVPAPTETVTRFVYDGNGARVKQITPNRTTRYVGDLYEVAPDGTTTKYFMAGWLRAAAKDSTGAARFYHADHLGGTNVVTDAAGAVAELAEYLPYGDSSRREGAANVAHQFTGQRLDATTGLYFYNARYYDPALGRFVSPDTIIPDVANPQALNRYSYVLNNPVRYVDPTGHAGDPVSNFLESGVYLSDWMQLTIGQTVGAVSAWAGGVSASMNQVTSEVAAKLAELSVELAGESAGILAEGAANMVALGYGIKTGDFTPSKLLLSGGGFLLRKGVSAGTKAGMKAAAETLANPSGIIEWANQLTSTLSKRSQGNAVEDRTLREFLRPTGPTRNVTTTSNGTEFLNNADKQIAAYQQVSGSSGNMNSSGNYTPLNVTFSPVIQEWLRMRERKE